VKKEERSKKQKQTKGGIRDSKRGKSTFTVSQKRGLGIEKESFVPKHNAKSRKKGGVQKNFENGQEDVQKRRGTRS